MWPSDDPARLKATYVPDNVSFLTKPQLAVEMIERALAAGVPFRWVAGDSVYGVGNIERDLRQAGKGYVLGVNSNHWFASWGKPQRVAGTAEEIAKTQRRSDWRRLSAGAGTKGPRLHDWCYLELADLQGEDSNHHSQVLWTRGLLIRRNIANGGLIKPRHRNLISNKNHSCNVRLATSPTSTGLTATAKMIGIVEVAALAAKVDGVPMAAITVTRRRTNSAASSASRSFCPAAQ